MPTLPGRTNILAIYLLFPALVNNNWCCSRLSSHLNPEFCCWYNVFVDNFNIINPLTNKQLDVVDGCTKVGTPVQMFEASQELKQQWYFTADGTIRSATNDLAISSYGCINKLFIYCHYSGKCYFVELMTIELERLSVFIVNRKIFSKSSGRIAFEVEGRFRELTVDL